MKLIPEILRRYVKDKNKPVTCFKSLTEIGNYLYPKFVGLDHECLYMMMLDNRMSLIDCIRVSEGAVNSSSVPLRLMTNQILQRKASAVVLAHNHPNGLAMSSQQDVEITDNIDNLFSILDITLVEHLVVNETKFYPIMRHHTCGYRTSPVNSKNSQQFYDAFYDKPEDEYYFPPIFEDTKE